MKNFWCEIYLDKLYNNLKVIKEMADGKKIIAVVKGNAYGLGIEEITTRLNDKVDYFAVSDINEAALINTDKEILLLSPLVSKDDFNTELNNIIFTIDNKAVINELPKDKAMKVHIYVDTGMNRMGVKCSELAGIISEIKEKYPNVIVDGIYTHLHNAKNVKYTLKQIEDFKKCTEPFKDEVNMIHCLNSSGFINDEIRSASYFTNAVRAGNILYGYDGFNKGIRRAYNYFAKPVNVYDVSKGEHVGYGGTYKAKRNIKIGILGFGNIEHFGFSKDIDKGFFFNVVRAAYNSLKFRPEIFDAKSGRGIRIVSKPNMNITIVDMEGLTEDSLLRIEISPILADSRITKKYIE